ncbi:ZIP family metal transporter [Halobacteria archaeon AArc-dxtr1]|nr:ZIP family metal transporter [Halobacteria archaeon AArc-dxtr1]
MSDVWTVLAITTVAGLATGLGAIPVFVRTRVSHRVYDAALGLAAGMMISASAFALIMPGLEIGTVTEVVAGVLVGGVGLLIANRLFPHVHAHYNRWTGHGGGPDTEPAAADALRRAVLIGGAITLHNAPEGLAIGVAFASGLEGVGLAVAVVIALQNVPDGFAFAVPMAETGLSRPRVLLYTALSGAVPQVVAALAGFLLVEFIDGLFPLAAGFAAGAMIAVVFREMVPQSHGHGYADAATAAFLAGFSLLVVVDVLLVV